MCRCSGSEPIELARKLCKFAVPEATIPYRQVGCLCPALVPRVASLLARHPRQLPALAAPSPGSPLYSRVLWVRDPRAWRLVSRTTASGPEPKVLTGEKEGSEAPTSLCPA